MFDGFSVGEYRPLRVVQADARLVVQAHELDYRDTVQDLKDAQRALRDQSISVADAQRAIQAAQRDWAKAVFVAGVIGQAHVNIRGWILFERSLREFESQR